MIRANRLLSVFAGAAIALASSSPAAADTTQLQWLGCMPGATTTGTMTPPLSFADMVVSTQVQLNPCQTPSLTHAYAIASYSPIRSSGDVQRYQDLNSNGSAGVLLQVERDVHAVCLIVKTDRRIDCYELLWATDAPYAGNRLAVDSPLVSMNATVKMTYSEEDGPGCMTCGD